MIIVRITLTESKAALAGVMFDTPFARFKVSMAAFNAEIGPSRSLCRRELVSMVEIRGSCKRTVQREGREEGPPDPDIYERQSCHDTPGVLMKKVIPLW